MQLQRPDFVLRRDLLDLPTRQPSTTRRPQPRPPYRGVLVAAEDRVVILLLFALVVQDLVNIGHLNVSTARHELPTPTEGVEGETVAPAQTPLDRPDLGPLAEPRRRRTGESVVVW